MPHAASHRLIPQGELRCIWMDAGIIAYKLCDRSFQCEGCPFDDVIRSFQSLDRSQSGAISPSAMTEESPALQEDDPAVRLFERWVQSVSRQPFPDDRLYHVNHSWTKILDPETARIGLDHCASGLMGIVSSIVQPSVAFRTETQAPCTWLVLNETTITVHAPLSGRTTLVNEELQSNPSLLFSDPYGEGWLFEAEPDSTDEFNRLLDARAIDEAWKRQCEEMRAVVMNAAGKRPAALGKTLYDGGFPIERIQDLLGAKEFCRLINRLMMAGST